MKRGRKNVFRYIVREQDGWVMYSGNCRGAAEFIGYSCSYVNTICKHGLPWRGGFKISREVI